MIEFLAIAVLMTSSSLAPSQDATPLPPANSRAENKLVCKAEGLTGSRLGRGPKVCRTKQEWAEAREQARQQLEGAQGARGTR